MHQILSIICLVGYLGGLIAAAGWDLVSYKIPNRLVLLIAASSAIAVAANAPDLAAAMQYFGVAAAVLVGGAALFFLNIWGAGDAKLLAAVALSTGYQGLMVILFWTAMVGGILAAVLLLLRRLPFINQTRLQPALAQLLSPKKGVPYGVAIGVSAVIALIENATVFTDPFLGR